MLSKEDLIRRLRISILSLLQAYEKRPFASVKDSVITSSICSVLEAIFLHGLLPRSGSLFSIQGIWPSNDQLSFWHFLKALVPNHLLDILNNTGSKRNNIGRCRVWIRYSLNEACLHSYLMMVVHEFPQLRNFYASDAILHDRNSVVEIANLIEMLEGLRFKLDLSSPLLNSWKNSGALQLLGLPSDYRVLPATVNVNEDLSPSVPLLSSPYEDGLVSEDELQAIGCKLELSWSVYSSVSGSPGIKKDYVLSSSATVPIATVGSDQLTTTPADPSEGTKGVTHRSAPTLPAVTQSQSSPTPVRSKSGAVYRPIAAIQSTNLSFPAGSNNIVRQHLDSWIPGLDIDLSVESTSDGHEAPAPGQSTEAAVDNREVTGSLAKGDKSSKPEQTPESGDDASWQVVGEDLLVTLTNEDVTRLISLFPGAFNFDYDRGKNCVFHGQCVRCECYLTHGCAFLDCYDARFYCSNCHQLQEAIIPREVIFNWNFTYYHVSQTTKSFLNGLYNKPVINLAKLNPTLYAIVPELLVVRQLRRALIHLWHQIVRCDAKAASDIRRALHPLDYMLYSLNDLDLFSMSNLVDVQSGHLQAKIADVITNVALAHVHACQACRRRSLLCNLCENPANPIWPHEFTTYKRCTTPGCLNVMHVSCINAARENLPTNVGCLTCRAANGPNSSPPQIAIASQRCRTCTVYSKSLAMQQVGHYADPFLPNAARQISTP
ncbi:unnamed protein product [Calicophoron daubneyi]|uniref:RUN domain-containing protein n=1 Tax=Calicophoron daubneyi TaxID=300641 RepID=A0AAV2T8U6_CALDB